MVGQATMLAHWAQKVGGQSSSAANVSCIKRPSLLLKLLLMCSLLHLQAVHSTAHQKPNNSLTSGTFDPAGP